MFQLGVKPELKWILIEPHLVTYYLKQLFVVMKPEIGLKLKLVAMESNSTNKILVQDLSLLSLPVLLNHAGTKDVHRGL